MKMSVAQEMINKPIVGYMVHFEVRDGGVLRGDYFPEYRKDDPDSEELIPDVESAWDMAQEFARGTVNTRPEIINIYVIDHNYRPVANYNSKTFRRYEVLTSTY